MCVMVFYNIASMSDVYFASTHGILTSPSSSKIGIGKQMSLLLSLKRLLFQERRLRLYRVILLILPLKFLSPYHLLAL